MASMEHGQCKSCACDYFQAKGRNIRRFWEYVGAIIGIMLVLYLFGSCFGCSACFECAAACDQNCGCELEDCGREFYDQVGCGSCNNEASDCSTCKQECGEVCDDCVRNEGVNCGNTENCGACVGFGDCSGCKGYKVYRVTIVVGDKEYEEKLYDKSEKLPIYYPDGAGEEYFEFEGYWTDEDREDGDRYVTAEGEYVADLQAKDGLTLYGHYKEKNFGDKYTLRFSGAKLPAGLSFSTPAPIEVAVGSPITDFPDPQEIDGYDFKGWYTANERCVTNAEGYYKSSAFHLYDVGVNPNDQETTSIMLFAKYEKCKYSVQLIEMLDGSINRTDTVLVEYGEYLSVNSITSKLAEFMGNGSAYKCLGLSWESNPDIHDETKFFTMDKLNTEMVDDTVKIYVINRSMLTVKLYYDVSGKQPVEYRAYNGERVVFADMIDMNNGNRKVGDLVAEDSFNPGKRFIGWYEDAYSDPATYVDVVKNGWLEYTAHWETKTYYITYIGPAGNKLNGFDQQYPYLYQEDTKLLDLGYDNTYGRFLGWCERADRSDSPKMWLYAYGSGAYGDKTLYAKYENM